MRAQMTALALAILPGLLAAQASPIQQPTCSADRRGDRLITVVQYPNGYIAEAPWRVANTRTSNIAGRNSIKLTATLDRVIEYNPENKERVATPFPSLIEITFEAEDESGILEAAADVWCSTVARVRSTGEQDTRKPVATPFKVTLLSIAGSNRA